MLLVFNLTPSIMPIYIGITVLLHHWNHSKQYFDILIESLCYHFRKERRRLQRLQRHKSQADTIQEQQQQHQQQPQQQQQQQQQPEQQQRHKRAATARRERLWDDGVIPYEIEGNFSGTSKCKIDTSNSSVPFSTLVSI